MAKNSAKIKRIKEKVREELEGNKLEILNVEKVLRQVNIEPKKEDIQIGFKEKIFKLETKGTLKNKKENLFGVVNADIGTDRSWIELI